MLQICLNIKNKGWTEVDDLKMGPYAYKGNQWVGYDTPKSAKNKANYIVEKGLKGGMIWDYSTDDFGNKCGLGAYPVMNAIKSGLCNAANTPAPTKPTPAPTTPSPPASGGKKFVCYYPNWAYWRTGDGKFKVANIDPFLCTHVVYSFAVLDTSNFGLKAHDSWLVKSLIIYGILFTLHIY